MEGAEQAVGPAERRPPCQEEGAEASSVLKADSEETLSRPDGVTLWVPEPNDFLPRNLPAPPSP